MNTQNLFLYSLLAIFIMSFSNPNEPKYPQGYFRSPVGHYAKVSGTFGELRPNHFHSGIDIKSSKGKIGDPLYASATGFVSRIKVQASGYGKALYIDHPNGYTTVYAHLDKFTPEIEKYIKEQQYARESFFVDLNPEQGRFTFEQGEKVGTMGNTGRSYGPHIHFEIRDTPSEEPINPLLFGLPIKDNTKPRLHQIKIYELNDKHETIGSRVKDVNKSKSGKYYIGGDTLSIKAWRMGVGIKAYDQLDGVPNWNGVYRIETLVDDVLVHETKFERFHFDNTRYINSHVDYRERMLKKAWFNRCYRLPGNHLPMYPTMTEDGVFAVSATKTQEVTINVYDSYNNKSSVRFWVKRAKEIQPEEKEVYNYTLQHNSDNYVERDDIALFFPYGTLYENLYLKYASSPSSGDDTFSSTHHIHDDTNIPLHKWYEIAIKGNNVPEHLREKAIIAKCSKSKTPVNYGGKWKGDYLVTEARDLGDYCLIVDDIPPKVTPTIFKTNMKGYSRMAFKLDDNFETSRKIDEFIWKGYIDGQWVLFEHDAKTDVITHRFEKTLAAGEHTLRLEVRDDRGNLNLIERKFTR